MRASARVLIFWFVFPVNAAFPLLGEQLHGGFMYLVSTLSCTSQRLVTCRYSGGHSEQHKYTSGSACAQRAGTACARTCDRLQRAQRLRVHPAITEMFCTKDLGLIPNLPLLGARLLWSHSAPACTWKGESSSTRSVIACI